MPITWGAIHQLHASLYYTIEALKLDPSTHSAVFVTIHKEGKFFTKYQSNTKLFRKIWSSARII